MEPDIDIEVTKFAFGVEFSVETIDDFFDAPRKHLRDEIQTQIRETDSLEMPPECVPKPTDLEIQSLNITTLTDTAVAADVDFDRDDLQPVPDNESTTADA